MFTIHMPRKKSWKQMSFLFLLQIVWGAHGCMRSLTWIWKLSLFAYLKPPFLSMHKSFKWLMGANFTCVFFVGTNSNANVVLFHLTHYWILMLLTCTYCFRQILWTNSKYPGSFNFFTLNTYFTSIGISWQEYFLIPWLMCHETDQ